MAFMFAADATLIRSKNHNVELSENFNVMEEMNREEELTVGGETGLFAFARRRAVFAQTDRKETEADMAYYFELQLRVPDLSQTIPG
ncbi:hypothetical protein CDL15_Pgr006829 [Punica granatum]|uniref:Dirigent protein n=1 Tax=Punica granatum TaxID=22663 RepID=A0A218X7X4_PUNGR|nr:hypothetical protein CDL15_Pgr006829 [Punica granatum]